MPWRRKYNFYTGATAFSGMLALATVANDLRSMQHSGFARTLPSVATSPPKKRGNVGLRFGCSNRFRRRAVVPMQPRAER